MSRTTGKFDAHGEEIFEGSKVLKCWGWFTFDGEMKNRYRMHTIVVRPAHRMGDGQMHDDGGGIIFCMGNTVNFWQGKELNILSPELVEKTGFPEETDFFFDENDNPVRFTDQHFLGLEDKAWEKYLEERKQAEFNLLFGKRDE